ncbi:MAG: phosphoadenylyl-sulfate reductase [Gammaproteobacteria bacterium]|nr:phosphoadenylyl-sulfate reductase [Gammaproteobacteria bacterium]
MLFDPDTLKRKSGELESASPQEILRFAFDTYPKIAISTAFGLDGCALIDIATKIKPDVQVFTIDTDYLFAESLALRDRLIEKYQLNLTVLKPLLTIEQQAQQHGADLYKSDPDKCCSIRKIEPNIRAIAGLDAWIAGLRRDQARTRVDIDILERYDHDDGTPYVKIHPFANWDRKTMWAYVIVNEVPYNPLLDQGYKSIGCWPCTKPVAEDGNERDGRWAGQDKLECGIHTFAKRKA